MKSRQFGRSPVEVGGRALTLACPSISLARVGAMLADEKLYVEGMHFGAIAPDIFVEYRQPTHAGDNYLYKKCTIVKGETLLYMDAQRKAGASCMRVYADDAAGASAEPVGFSRACARLPEPPPKSESTGYIILMNNVGMAVFPIAEAN